MLGGSLVGRRKGMLGEVPRDLGELWWGWQMAHLVAWVPQPLSPQWQGCCGRQGQGTVPQNSVPAETGGLAAGTVLLRGQSMVGATLVTSVRHPTNGPAAGSASCFPWDSWVCCMFQPAARALLTSSRSSYWSMMLFSFSASSVFSWQSFMFLSLCCSIWAWISLSVPWKWLVISFLFSSSSRARWIVSSCC